MSRLPLNLFCCCYIFFCDTSCGTETSVQVSEDVALRHEISALRADYDSLRLWEALTNAQRLRARIDSDPPKASSLTAEVYQYLALLYHERGDEGGVIDNAKLAAAQLGTSPTATVRARQFLCEAYVKYTEWEWLEMDMMAALGLQTLLDHGVKTGVLHGELLLAQYRARRKYAASGLAGGNRPVLEKQSYALAEKAKRVFQTLGSPRERHAWEELLLDHALRPSAESVLTSLLDSLQAAPRVTPPIYGFPDRILGYWHLRHDRADSVRHYYESLLADAPFFRLRNVREARYILGQQAMSNRDFGRALQLLRSDAAVSQCGASDTPDAYASKYVCPYFQVAYARIYLARYAVTNELDDLQEAYAISQSVLRQYHLSFPSDREEGVLNKLLEVGQAMLDVCLSSASLLCEREPAPEHTQGLFNVMELSRNLLLHRDLAAIQQHDPQREGQRMRAALIAKKQAYAAAFHLPTQELLSYYALDTTYRTLQLTSTTAEIPNRIAHITEVQTSLRADQALLTSAETDSTLYFLCITRDTTFTYSLSAMIARRADYLIHLLTGSTEVSPTTYSTLSYAVYRQLLGPVEQLGSHVRELLIVPPTSLAQLPLSALTTAASPQAADYGDLAYVLDRYRIRYVQSWRLEAEQQPRRGSFRPTGLRIGVWTHQGLAGYLGGLGE